MRLHEGALSGVAAAAGAVKYSALAVSLIDAREVVQLKPSTLERI
jgi:hypothetical protein